MQPTEPTTTPQVPPNTTTPPPSTSVTPESPEASSPQSQSAGGFALKKLSKKLWIVLAAAAVVLIGGGIASAMWWTSPQKSFDDAMNLNQAFPKGGAVKGSMVMTPKDGPSMTLDFDTKYTSSKSNTNFGFKVNAGAVNVNLTGGFAASDTKSVYFKLNDIRKTVETFAGSSADMVDQAGAIIDKLDGKWVEVTEADMKQLSDTTGADPSCALDTIKKITSDQSYTKDLASIYDKNKYFTLKETVGSEQVDGRDSVHVVVAVDKAKMEAFNTAMQDSKLAADLKKCMTETDDGLMVDSTDSDQLEVPKIELWIDKWSHKVTKIVMTQDQDDATVKLTANLMYDDGQKVDIPKADTQFSDLLKDIESLQGPAGMYPSSDSLEDFDLTQI